MSHLTVLARAILLVLFAGAAAAQAAAPAASAPVASSADDPYLWLEKVDDPKAMDWVRAENRKTLTALEADPRFAAYNAQALAIAQTRDRRNVASCRCRTAARTRPPRASSTCVQGAS